MHQTRAIVIQKIKYSESSLILKIYTEREGLLSFLVRGVRGKKGKMRSAQFQVLNLLEISYSKSSKSELRHIQDLKIIAPFTELLFKPEKRAIGMFIAELIQHSIKEQEPNKALFDFLFNSIQWLDLSAHYCSHFHLYFMMKLTAYLGFSPSELTQKNMLYFDLQQGEYTAEKPHHPYVLERGEVEAWIALQNSSINTFDQLRLSNRLKRNMVHALMNYYKLHLIHFKELNSHHILQTVFEHDEV